MTKEQIDAVLDSVRLWPQEDQEELVEIVREIEARRSGLYVMNDEEYAAVGEGLEQACRGDFVPDDEPRHCGTMQPFRATGDRT